jgi:hypothetical protein
MLPSGMKEPRVQSFVTSNVYVLKPSTSIRVTHREQSAGDNALVRRGRSDLVFSDVRSEMENLARANNSYYVESEFLDQSPYPVDDWILISEYLPKGVVLTLNLKLWISADGRIDRFEVNYDNVTHPWLKGYLKNIKETEMIAARDRNGPVASVMYVEMQVRG